MNVDRGALPIRTSPSAGAESRAARGAPGDAPGFSLDLPKDESSAPKPFRRDPSAERPERRDVLQARDATRGTPDSRRGDDASLDSEANANDEVTQPTREAPNAAARHARETATHERGQGETQSDQSPAATSSTESGRPEGSRDAAPARDDTDLPDRMLALLGGEWPGAAPAAMPAATPTGLPGSPLAAVSAAGGAPLPAAAGAVDAAALLAPAGTPNTPAPGGAPPAAIVTGATPATPASADAFAALAALADRGAERESSLRTATDGSVSAVTDAPLTAGPLRGTDGLASPARVVAVATPASTPLAFDADFDDGLGSRITWMAEQRLGQADIRVSPEGLGTIDVRLQMDGSRVNAQFHAANAEIRQALESGLERLRDLLGRQGMELGQAQVGSGSRQQGDGRPATPGSGASAAGTDSGEPQATTVRLLRARGLLDEYA